MTLRWGRGVIFTHVCLCVCASYLWSVLVCMCGWVQPGCQCVPGCLLASTLSAA